MNNNLTQASNQWCTRPADERFWSLEEMQEGAQKSQDRSYETKLYPSECTRGNLGIRMDEGDLCLGVNDDNLRFNNWSFGQFCNRVRAPADYIVGLDDPDLAARCLNRSLDKSIGSFSTGLGILATMDDDIRAITSTRYSRINVADIIGKLIPLQEHGWKAPPGRASIDDPRSRLATVHDLTKSTLIKEGDRIGPSGLYRGDRDMFCFLVNDDGRVDDGSDGGISRGFFVSNSEVGKASFAYTEFGFRHTCGNHIVWGATDVREMRIRHVGADTPAMAMETLAYELKEYTNESMGDKKDLITMAKNRILGKSADEVIDFLFGKRLMTRKLAKLSVEACEQFEADLNPYSAWGVVQGATRVSQDTEHTDKRTAIDTAAGKLLTLV